MWFTETVFKLPASTLSITHSMPNMVERHMSVAISQTPYMCHRPHTGMSPALADITSLTLQAAIGALEPHSSVTNPSTPCNLGRRFQ